MLDTSPEAKRGRLDGASFREDVGEIMTLEMESGNRPHKVGQANPRRRAKRAKFGAELPNLPRPVVQPIAAVAALAALFRAVGRVH